MPGTCCRELWSFGRAKASFWLLTLRGQAAYVQSRFRGSTSQILRKCFAPVIRTAVLKGLN